MKDRDFLWCAVNLMLDDEQELDGLCPSCRSRALEQRCSACGVPMELTNTVVNSGFDEKRFEQMKRGEVT